VFQQITVQERPQIQKILSYLRPKLYNPRVCVFFNNYNNPLPAAGGGGGGGGGGGAIATFTHKADSRWNWMVRCMPQQPYRYGKYNRHAVNRRVVGAQGQSGRFEVDLNFCHLLGIEPRLLWTSSSKTTTTTTTTTLSLSLDLTYI